jgi:hypothetical protein
MRRGSFLLLLAFVVPTGAAAYLEKNHEQFGGASADSSTLVVHLNNELGIIPGATFLGPGSPEPLTPRNWIREGCKREDVPAIRVLNHFYNPLDQRPLHVHGILFGATAPGWALEDVDGTQEWSLSDARRAFLRALTDSSPSSRQEQFGRTFRSLGQVMHLIQDMAQPQHTRNDPHLGYGIGPLIGAGGTSLYEAMTEARVDASGMTSYAPVFGDSDRTTFDRVRNLWHTASGAGLADYSNREFVSAGTNFRALPDVQPLLSYNLLPAPGLPSPNGQEATIETRDIQVLMPGSSLHGEVDFVVTAVDDHYRSELSASGVHTSTYSLFDADLAAAQQALTFSLNRFNFEDYWLLLLPRAVGYGAGLLNHFFRGRLGLTPVPGTSNVLLVRNLYSEAMAGTCGLYYDKTDGNRERIGSPWDCQLGAAGAASDNQQIAVNLPDDAERGEVTLAFDGKIGGLNPAVDGEDAVVGKVAGAPFWLFTMWYTSHLVNGQAIDCTAGWTVDQSIFVDRGWRRLAEQSTGCEVGNNSVAGAEYVTPDLTFISHQGAGLSPMQLTNQAGSISYAEVAGAPPSVYEQSITSLGGTELLMSYTDYAPVHGGTFYSADLGATWTDRPNNIGQGGPLVYAGAHTALLFSPSPNGTRRFYRSTDGGQTWQAIASVVVDGQPLPACNPSGDPLDTLANCPNRLDVEGMAWNHAADPESVVIAWANRFVGGVYAGNGLWASPDRGQTWNKLSDPDPGSPYIFNAAAGPNNEVMAITYSADGTNSLRLSFDLGATWQAASSPVELCRTQPTVVGGNGQPVVATACGIPVVIYAGPHPQVSE